jgi:hypothetical protein
MRRAWTPTTLTALVVGIAIWLSFGSLAVADATSSLRIGLLAPLWWLALFTAASIVLFRSVEMVRRARHVFGWSLLLLLPWLPIPVPDALLIWTGPVVLLVWTAIGLSALALLLQHTARPLTRVLCDARLAPRVACALAFVASVAVHANQRLPPAGDEPHYLLAAHSLVVDHDLEVSNNYEQGDYLAYYAGPLRPHYARPARDGSLYSGHGPGMPVLIAPALALGGYRGVVLWLAAIAALGTLFVWKAAHVLTSDVTAAWVAWAAVALTAPVILDSALVYPDVVAGTVLAAGVLAMLSAATVSIHGAAALGVGVGLLPWLHTRFAPLAVILAVVVASRLMGTHGGWRRWSPALLGLSLPIAASVAGWFLFSAYLYGTFDPLAAYGGRTPLQPEHVVTGLIGVIADQEFGLIPNAPVHLLWIGGTMALARHHTRLLVELAVIAGPYVLAVAAFPGWFGGSTPARYLAPLAFPLAVMVASLWTRQNDLGRSLSMALLLISVLIAGAFGFGATGMLAYNGGAGRSAWLDWAAPMVNLPGGFPSYFRAIPAEGPARGSLLQELVLPAGTWALISIAIWSLARWIDHRAPDTIDRPTLAAASLVAVLTAAVPSTWAITQEPHVIATRAQLELVAREGRPGTVVGAQLPPFQFMRSIEALQRLEISGSPLDALPADPLLSLSEVPAADYHLRLDLGAEPRGHISLLVGSAGGPIATWDLSEPDNTYHFRLPVPASGVTIVGDPPAAAAVRRIALVPIRGITPPWTAVTRARGAARYGQAVVYAIDERVILEPEGFWVLGGRQPDVVITTDDSRSRLAFQVSNVAIPNRVRVSHSAWSETRDLAPDEQWLVSVPLDDPDHPAILNFKVEQGAVVDGRPLGCRVRIVE